MKFNQNNPTSSTVLCTGHRRCGDISSSLERNQLQRQYTSFQHDRLFCHVNIYHILLFSDDGFHKTSPTLKIREKEKPPDVSKLVFVFRPHKHIIHVMLYFLLTGDSIQHFCFHFILQMFQSFNFSNIFFPPSCLNITSKEEKENWKTK